MKTRNVENGFALLGAVLVLLAVGVATNTAFNSTPQLEFSVAGHTSTLVASA